MTDLLSTGDIDQIANSAGLRKISSVLPGVSDIQIKLARAFSENEGRWLTSDDLVRITGVKKRQAGLYAVRLFRMGLLDQDRVAETNMWCLSEPTACPEHAGRAAQ